MTRYPQEPQQAIGLSVSAARQSRHRSGRECGAAAAARRAVGYLYTFQDVTDLKRLERGSQLQKRLAVVGEMAAGIAHEIRNPLASMSGSMQILRQELPLSTDQAQLMDIVLRESERLNETIRSFLAYAKPQRFDIQQLDLRRVIQETATLLRNSKEVGERHTMTIDLPAEEALVEADENQVRQIVWNLATNGLRAMPEGGDAASDGRARRSRWRAGRSAVRYGRRGWDRGRRNRRHLPAVPRLVRQGHRPGAGHRASHHHRLQRPYRHPVAARRGTTFRVTFPPVRGQHKSGRRQSSRVSGAPSGTPTRRSQRNGSAPRILIVDDEQSMREWMRILFQRDGFEVLVADDGVAARDCVAREYVDVVLTDIRMPRMDGLQLLRAVRDLAPDSIVIMMTAHFTRDSEEWRRARETGAAALLEKPFRDVNLVTMQVRQLIDARRVRHERDVLRQAISEQGFAGIVGRSQPMLDVFRMVETVCRTNSTILITGESGTGKELVARRDSRTVAAQRASIRGGQLRRAARNPARIRALRPCPRRVHRRRPEQEGPDRSRGQGHGVPRRDCRDDADDAGEIVARAAGAQVPPRWRDRRDASEHPYHRGDKPRSGEARPGREVPRGPVLPLERDPDSPAVAARARRRRAARRRPLPQQVQPARWGSTSTASRPKRSNRSRLIPGPATCASWRTSSSGRSPSNRRIVSAWKHFPIRCAPAGRRRRCRERQQILPEQGFNLERHLEEIERSHLERALRQSDGVQTRAAELLGLTFRQFRYLAKKYGLKT